MFVNLGIKTDFSLFKSLIKSYGDFKIFNDSGSIIAKNIDTDILGNSINLVATKGNVDLTSNSNINLDIDNLIFAGNSVKIKADTFHISPYSRIIAGYNSDLNLTITESMLDSNFLRDDPVTGERILINEFRINSDGNLEIKDVNSETGYKIISKVYMDTSMVQ